MSDIITDERAQAMQIGFILIFGILVLMLTMYQANIVPEQNRQAEITHSNDMEFEFSSIESNIFNTGMDGTPSTKVYPMSMRYQTRLITVNAPPPAGTLSTSRVNEITISNSSMEHNVRTRYLKYDLDYRYYQNPPTYTYETGFTYRNFGDAQTAISQNQFILNNGFSIVALQGVYNKTSYNSERLRFERTDSLVKYEITDPEITVPTKLSNEFWVDFASEKSNLDVISYDSTEETVTLSRTGPVDLYLTSVSLSDTADGGVNHEDIDLPSSNIGSDNPTDPTDPPTDPDRPPAEEVYDIRDESWLNNDERIFEVLQGYNPQWDLGDGTTSTDYYIQHQYNTPGTYDITFTITIDGDQYTYTDTVAIVDLTLEYSQRGNSGNYDFTWNTNPEVNGASVTFVANGNVVESGLSQSETDYRYSGNSGDDIEIQLVDSNGNIIKTTSTTI
jgi:hypothetical protein